MLHLFSEARLRNPKLSHHARPRIMTPDQWVTANCVHVVSCHYRYDTSRTRISLARPLHLLDLSYRSSRPRPQCNGYHVDRCLRSADLIAVIRDPLLLMSLPNQASRLETQHSYYTRDAVIATVKNIGHGSAQAPRCPKLPHRTEVGHTRGIDGNWAPTVVAQ